MGLPEVADFARITFKALTKGFENEKSGISPLQFRQDYTLSVRNAFYGFRLRRKIFWTVIVLTVASVIKPFLSQQYRDNAIQDKAHLIQGAQSDILVEGKSDAEDNDDWPDKESFPWLPAEILGIVDIPQSSTAVQSLIEASCGLMENGWEVGWSLASHRRGPQHIIGNSRAQELSNDHFRLRIYPSRASGLCWGPIQVIQVLWDN